jgi:hypothetical protein
VVTKRHTRVGVASAAIVVLALVATWISLDASVPEPTVATSPEDADALLNEAVRLVRNDNYASLCETLGSRSNCNVHLQEAQAAGLVPSKTKPEVIEATQVDGDEVSLRIQGTYANGRTYETEFHVFRDGEQLQAINVVYWLPIQYVGANCEHESGHVECGTPASPPSQ